MTGYAYSGYSTATQENWRDFIAKGRNKTSRTCANNTKVRLEGENIVFKLHDTDIVTILPNGNSILNSGGWLSQTTKERINRYTNAGISQSKGVWYMRDGSLFYDGIVIDENGQPKKAKNPEKYEKELKKIKKQARKYAKDYVQALKDGLIDYPSGGDCWACMIKELADSDHIKSHIDENYFVPSLLVNAGRDAGYRDDQIGLMGIGGQRLFIDPENVIYKYIVKQLQRKLSEVK